jgi:hypothetical protein
MGNVNDIDYLTDDNGDLIIENGDFKKGVATGQHIRDIIIASPGDYRQFPLVGFNIRKNVNGSFTGDDRKRLRLQLEGDGHTVNLIKEENGELKVDADRV